MICYSTIFCFWYVYSMFAVRLIPGFICKFLYIYAVLKCIFMQYVMVNRKLFGNFGFSCMFTKTSYLITFRFFRLLHVLRNQQKTECETKKPHFCRFCLKTSLFVANKTLVFSDLWVYRANYNLPPPFLALAGWVSSLPKIFYFFIFYFL
nr:MAG TPA: hypothetical protein [Caudoviricetes sp.]